MSKYIHTIDGRPATFDGYQICFATFYGKPNSLCDSLAQIKRERDITKKNRERDGYEFNAGEYGHLRYS